MSWLVFQNSKMYLSIRLKFVLLCGFMVNTAVMVFYLFTAQLGSVDSEGGAVGSTTD